MGRDEFRDLRPHVFYLLIFGLGVDDFVEIVGEGHP